MLTLPKKYDTLIAAFAPIFSRRVWPQVQVLIIGAILALGKRTVTSALQIMGMGDEEHFQNYHRVLNRAVWSSLTVSQVLLGLLVSAFASRGLCAEVFVTGDAALLKLGSIGGLLVVSPRRFWEILHSIAR